jgi:hypothetical protein
MFLLELSTLLFLYISQIHACCREYVGEIYELEYYYHSPIFSFFFLLFPFPFPFAFGHSFFIFHFTLYQLLSMGHICHFIKIYSFKIVLKYLFKGIQWCNHNFNLFF